MKILICVETVQEYIKVKPLINNLPNIISFCYIGQDKELLNNVNIDYKLDTNENISKNELNNTIANVLKYNEIFNDIEYIIIQNNSTISYAMALSAFNHGIKIINLEDNLNSENIETNIHIQMNKQIIIYI